MIDVSDNYHKPLKVLLNELDTTSKEIAVYCKSQKKASAKVVKTFRTKVNALISAILSGFRFKTTRRGVEFRFRIFTPHRVPRPNDISDIYNKIEIASGLMHKFQTMNGVKFEAPDMNKYKTLNDVKKDIEFLLTADLEVSDFMYIYQLRLRAERNAKLIALLAIAVLIGFGVVVYLKRTQSYDDDDDDDDDEMDHDAVVDAMTDMACDHIDEFTKDL